MSRLSPECYTDLPGSSGGIIAVIATKDRFDLLSKRSIPSVVQQSRIPDCLIVVDDSQTTQREQNRAYVTSFSFSSCKVIYLENRRMPGASGSWNTVLDFACQEIGHPESLFLAFLDDDDAWASTYLEASYEYARENQLDMVASDFRRFEQASAIPVSNQAPESLSSNDFLIRNPGIQGSNLFLRADLLLMAGGFDESLSSTTDRDVCIRIADLGIARYGRLPKPLMDHFADPDRTRLSTKGSSAKLEGLTAFWRKYFGRMSSSQRQAFADRSLELFDWRPPDQAPKDRKTNSFSGAESLSEPISEPPTAPPVSIFVGVITSDPGSLRLLLNGLVSLLEGKVVDQLVVLILENGSQPEELELVIKVARSRGLSIAVINEARQRRDAELGCFSAEYRIRPSGRVGIAQARTMLQCYLGAMLAKHQRAFGWVLDDDLQLDDRVLEYLPWLPFFRRQGVDVLLGRVEGSSPNPPLNGLRVQLLDVFYNLLWLRSLSPQQRLPDRSGENAMLRSKFPDYYYDLSRKHAGHLEMPYWLEPAYSGETVSEAYARLIEGAIGVLTGTPITRRIVVEMPPNPLASAKPSINRGGNTIILNHRALTDTPNVMLRFDGCEARRSDMIWAIINRHYRRMDIRTVDFPVHHMTRAAVDPEFNLEKVIAEIIGSSIYAGLSDYLSSREYHDLDFSSKETREIKILTQEYLSRRLLLLRQSFYRVSGIRRSLEGATPAGELNELLGRLDSWITCDNFYCISRDSQKTVDGDLESFLDGMRCISDDYASGKVDTEFIEAQFQATSVRGALTCS